MRRLYLRIYLAVLLSLAAFALVSGVLWRHFGDPGPWTHAMEIAGPLAQDILPPSDAPRASQQAALERLAARLGADLTLLGADRSPLAAVGDPLAPPWVGPERGAWPRRSGRSPWTIHLPDGRVLVARVHGDRPRLRFGLAATLGLVALAVAVGSYPVVRRLTSRLERLQAGVESLGAGDLSARVTVEGRDEVARLAESFNRAAERIEALVFAHKTLLANASHELRTPLARIRMAVELMKAPLEPEKKDALARDIAELDALIDEILTTSRLDAVTDSDVREDVDLLALASEECARDDIGDLGGEAVVVRGDRRLLRRLVRNLLENARRHGAPPVEVRVRRVGQCLELSVCDAGPGIPDTERERVFTPFYRFPGRADHAGTGLGLALVRQIARRHGGDARCVGREPRGACFVVTLPVA